MRRKLLIVLLLIPFFGHHLFAQKKKVKLYESFTDNSKNWDIGGYKIRDMVLYVVVWVMIIPIIFIYRGMEVIQFIRKKLMKPVLSKVGPMTTILTREMTLLIS